ncbi:MAG: cupin [Xanthobacteraceae bacterium]|nr:cupin [Xanthobacteraceae bacterium]
MARLCVPTVMSGVFYIGLGEDFDAEKVIAYPPGSVVVLPGDTWHFHWAKSGEYVTQVSAIGPLGLERVANILLLPRAGHRAAEGIWQFAPEADFGTLPESGPTERGSSCPKIDP